MRSSTSLRDDGLRAPLQVYRALEKLLDMGLAHRLESMNAFVACAHPHCHDSGLIAFAICEKCGQVSEFSDDVVRERLTGWADREGFVVKRTTMEIRGDAGFALQREALVWANHDHGFIPDLIRIQYAANA